METIYKIISSNPEYFACVFGLINALWVAFLYFNKKRHEKEILQLKHGLNLDLEKRKKIYEMKSGQFEKYFKMADDFGKKHQVDLPKRLQPIFNEYMENYLKASMNADKEAERKCIVKFGEQVSSIMNQGMEEYFALKSETNSLKLIASEELARIFEEVQDAYEKAFNTSNEFMGKFVEITAANNSEENIKYQELMKEQGENIQEKLNTLMKQMRKELNEI